MSQHLSTFELDVHFASGEENVDIDEHVASCASCASYLEELKALSTQEIRLPVGRPGRSTRTRLRFVGPAVGTLALAGAVALYVRGRPAVDESSYVGSKGTPAVQVLVRRDGVTRVWDGHSPVHAGDALAIRVACEQLEYVAVAVDGPAGVARLSDGACPKTPAPLPFTLVVDDQPGRERFSVVLTRTRVMDAKLGELVRSGTRSRDVWVTAFDFAKERR